MNGVETEVKLSERELPGMNSYLCFDQKLASIENEIDQIMR